MGPSCEARISDAGLQLLQPIHQLQIRKTAAIGIDEGFFVGRDDDSLNCVHSGRIGRRALLPSRSLPRRGINARDCGRQSHGIVDEERFSIRGPAVDGIAGWNTGCSAGCSDANNLRTAVQERRGVETLRFLDFSCVSRFACLGWDGYATVKL